jgi:hypothetical protein
MRQTSWKVCALVAALALAATWGARAEDKDEHKAEDFKGKTFELKAKTGKGHVTLSFAADKKAKIIVKSDTKTDVNLFVYDADKKQVAKDDSPGPDCEIVFTPRKAGKYTLEVVNVGKQDTKSTLEISWPKGKDK